MRIVVMYLHNYKKISTIYYDFLQIAEKINQ